MSDFFGGPVAEETNRNRLPNVGKGEIVIDKLFIQKTRKFGDCPAFSARIAQSDTDQTGAEVGQAYFLNADEFGYARGRFLKFGAAMFQSLGQNPDDATAFQNFLNSVYKDPQRQAQQPIRGLRLRYEVTENGKDKQGKDVARITFEPVTQTPEQIKAGREQLDRWKAGAVPAQVAPTAAAAPAVPWAAPAGGNLPY